MSGAPELPQVGAAPRPGWAAPAAYAAALLPFAWLAWRFAWTCDDAYITFAYARSLAEGHGFVHHADAPPVEGTTELFWTLWCALGLRLGLPVEGFAGVTSAAAGALVVTLVVRASRGLPPGPRIAAALALGASPPLAVWATSGMGVAPFVLALLLTFLAATRSAVPALGAGLAASAAVGLRADGAWWVAWILGPALVGAWRRRDVARAQALLLAAGLSALTLLGIIAWRLSTFGDWLPNTARAKLGIGWRATERGLDYVAHFALTFPGCALLLALGVAGARRNARARAALFVVLATLLHAALVGGDFMAFGRFVVPALPFLALAAGAGLTRLPGRGALALAAGLVVVVADLLPAFDRHVAPERWRAAVRFRFNPGPRGGAQPFVSEVQQWTNMRLRVEEWAATGRDLERLSPPGASVVAGAVGALGYFSRRRIHDRHGLLSPEVARQPPSMERRSPGHDRVVPPSFFAPESPTYDEVGLWPRAAWAQHPYGAAARVLGESEVTGYVLWALPGPGG